MTIKIDLLTSGTLPSAQGQLFISESSGASIRVTLVNTSNATVKVNIWAKNGTLTARRVLPKDLEISAQEAASTDYIELGNGDSIEGAGGGNIEYTVKGILQS